MGPRCLIEQCQLLAKIEWMLLTGKVPITGKDHFELDRAPY